MTPPEIRAITAAPPGYWVLQPFLQREEPVDAYGREGVIAFAIGRSWAIPITTQRTAEQLWSSPYALLRPDGVVEDGDYEFDTVEAWQKHLRETHPNWPGVQSDRRTVHHSVTQARPPNGAARCPAARHGE